MLLHRKMPCPPTNALQWLVFEIQTSNDLDYPPTLYE